MKFKFLLISFGMIISLGTLFAAQINPENSNPSCTTLKVTLRCGAEYEDCVVPTLQGFSKFIIMMMIFTNMYCPTETIEPPSNE